jgi:hypothetical protein
MERLSEVDFSQLDQRELLKIRNKVTEALSNFIIDNKSSPEVEDWYPGGEGEGYPCKYSSRITTSKAHNVRRYIYGIDDRGRRWEDFI